MGALEECPQLFNSFQFSDSDHMINPPDIFWKTNNTFFEIIKALRSQLKIRWRIQREVTRVQRRLRMEHDTEIVWRFGPNLRGVSSLHPSFLPLTSRILLFVFVISFYHLPPRPCILYGPLSFPLQSGGHDFLFILSWKVKDDVIAKRHDSHLLLHVCS